MKRRSELPVPLRAVEPGRRLPRAALDLARQSELAAARWAKRRLLGRRPPAPRLTRSDPPRHR